MRNEKLIQLIKISILSVMAFLLMYIELPIPFFPEFLKIDISDLPALLGAFALGPTAGVIVELIKNILHGLLAGKTGFVGELANFLVGASLIIVAGTLYKRNKTKKGAIYSLVIATMMMSIIAGVLNYVLILPLYEKVLGFPMKAIVGMGTKVNTNITDLKTFILWAIIPFNVLKGIVVSAMTLAVYKKVSPVLHKEVMQQKDMLHNNKLQG